MSTAMEIQSSFCSQVKNLLNVRETEELKLFGMERSLKTPVRRFEGITYWVIEDSACM